MIRVINRTTGEETGFFETDPCAPRWNRCLHWRQSAGGPTPSTSMTTFASVGFGKKLLLHGKYLFLYQGLI